MLNYDNDELREWASKIEELFRDPPVDCEYVVYYDGRIVLLQGEYWRVDLGRAEEFEEEVVAIIDMDCFTGVDV